MPEVNLGTWAKKSGFLMNWYIKGVYDSGLIKNPSPNLFDEKTSDFWYAPVLDGWSPENLKVSDVLNPAPSDILWNWKYFRSEFYPDLKLTDLKEKYLDWCEEQEGINTNTWSKLYYVANILEVKTDIKVTLKFCGWDGCRLWLNGENIFNEHSYHKAIYEKESVVLDLKTGKNLLLFQLDRDGLVARVDSDAVILEGLKEVSKTTDNNRMRFVGSFAQLYHSSKSLTSKNKCRQVVASEKEIYKAKLKNHLCKSLGLDSLETNIKPVSVSQIDSVDKGLYYLNSYHLKNELGFNIPCYHLKPKISNGKTVLALHGHVKDYRYLLGINTPPDGPNMCIGEYTGDYARRFAEAGFETFGYCQAGFSDRRDLNSNDDACTKLQQLASTIGKSLPLYHLEEIHMMYDFMSTFNEVDQSKIGVTGLSGGGFLAMLAGAFDERFKAVAIYCGICRYVDFTQGQGCGMQIIPGWFPFADTPELLSLVEPRPLLMGQGKLDSTFNILRFEDMASDVKDYYRNQNNQDSFHMETYDLAHEFDFNSACAFFSEKLK